MAKKPSGKRTSAPSAPVKKEKRIPSKNELDDFINGIFGKNN